jgi:hypothetical protein
MYTKIKIYYFLAACHFTFYKTSKINTYINLIKLNYFNFGVFKNQLTKVTCKKR